MSTFISDDFAAVKFTAEDLQKQLDHYRLTTDKFMMFELGGYNNTSQAHPRTGREVRSRDWHLIGSGSGYEVMSDVVMMAASCEGGTMRLAKERDTHAETYIRKARTTMAEAVTGEALSQAGLGCIVRLQIPSGIEIPPYRQKDIDELTALLAPVVREGNREWILNPLHDLKHAAILFTYGHIDERKTYNKARVIGREYDGGPIMSRAKCFTQAQLELA